MDITDLQDAVRLLWGVKESFVAYVVGAEGTVRASGVSGNAYVFERSSEHGDAVRFDGSVAFEAYGGMLAVTITDPVIAHEGDGLVLRVIAGVGAHHTIARLAVRERTPGEVVLSATLTATGTALLGGVYRAGDALDDLHVVMRSL